MTRAARPADAFPHTRRPLPWLLAGFLVVLFVVPIDSTQVRFHLPVSSFFDRFVVALLVLAWAWFGGDQRAILRTPRSKMFVGSAFAFVALVIASVLLDSGRLINLGQFSLAQKQFAQIASYVAVGWFLMSALRYEDLRGFCSFLIGLATFLALGVCLERKTGYNLFYTWTPTFLGHIATVAPSPTIIHPAFGSDGRVTVVGPTVHGLAVTAMLMSVFPLALVRALDQKARNVKLRNALAALLMVVAAAATDRKTALIVPVVLVIYIGIYRPRMLVRFIPVLVVLAPVVIHFAAPGALGVVLDPGAAAQSSSTTHRVGDFAPVLPDIYVHPLFGRGYGAVDPIGEPQNYRVNDNQYVDMIQQIGILGLLAYVWMIISPAVLARRAIRGRDPTVASLALGASAGCVAFLIVNALFDTMSFPQAPYIFFIMAGLTTIAAGGPAGNCEPAAGALWRRRAADSALAATRRRVPAGHALGAQG